MKRLVSTILVLALMVTAIPFSKSEVYAANKKEIKVENVTDLYESEMVEEVEIEGEIYIYSYFYDAEGNASISINNITKQETEVLTYVDETNKLYLDDELIGNVESLEPVVEENGGNNTRDAYEYYGALNKKVSWKKGITYAAVAAAIAVVLPSISAKMIIASVGVSVLGVLAAGAIGGTVKGSIYKLASNYKTQYKYVWSFTASTNETYGTFTNYTAVG